MIDGSVFIDLERSGRQPADLARAYPDDRFSMAVITVSELWHGMYRANSTRQRQQHEAFVDAILQAFEVIPFDLRVARQHAFTWTQLVRTGRKIKAHDLLIAATALAHGFTVLTRDVQDFSRVPGLAVRVFEENVSQDQP